MSKEIRRPTRTTGLDENKMNALKKIKEARLKGISGVQQMKDEFQIEEGGILYENTLDKNLEDDFIEDDGDDHGYVFKEYFDDIEENQPKKEVKLEKNTKSIMNYLPEMTKAAINKKPETKKQDKELKKKAENLMENLFNALDEDDLIDDISQRPKINEYVNINNNMNIDRYSNSETKNHFYIKNSKNDKKGNINLNEIELNPIIAPKISQKLENSKNNNNLNLNNNKSLEKKSKTTLDNDLEDYDIPQEENHIEKTQIQNIIEKNNKNILCGREIVVVDPIKNINNNKRTRDVLESEVNKNILAGRTINKNNKIDVLNNSKNMNLVNNSSNNDLTNNIITPIKNITFNENKNQYNNNIYNTFEKNNFNQTSNNQNTNNNSLTNSNISLRNSNSFNLPYNSDKSLFVYWFDMIEETIKSDHFVIIFGKIYEPEENKFSSISIILKNIERTLFIIPKDDPLNGGKFSIESVKNEFYDLKKKHFSNFDKIKTKQTRKKYCFELPIEHGEHDCLEIKYNSNYGHIPSNLKSTSFDYIFGKNSSLLETVLIEKNIRGPCWLKIQKDAFKDKNGNNHLTWSKYEIEIEDYAKAFNVFDIKNSSKDQTNNNNNTIDNIYQNNPSYEYLKSSPPLGVLSISTKTISINDQVELYSICGSFIEKYQLEDEKGENEKQTLIPFIIVRKIDHPHIKLENLENLKNSKEFRGSSFMIAQNETAVINQFINKLYQYDPDVIVGHKLFTEHLDLVINRINKLKINNWSKIGRLKRDCAPKFIPTHSREINILRLSTYGRLICDTLLSCKDMIKDSNFNLDHLSKKVLGLDLYSYDPNIVFSKEIDYSVDINNNSNMEKYETRILNKIELVKSLINGILLESIYTYLLLNKLSILSLTKELTTIAGNLWIKSLQNNRADRCELLLMHEFHKNNFILPDKLTKLEKEELDENDENNFITKGNKRKPQYSGGLVLEPKADLYDTIILLLDFNSLYPSIIQEFNICFTTVIRKPSQQFFYKENTNGDKKKKTKGKKTNNENDNDAMDTESEIAKNNNKEQDIVDEANLLENDVDINDFNLDLIKRTKDNPILPGILASLVSRRKKIKDQMKFEKDNLKKDLLEIKQKAVKLSANSLYGYLGYKNSRFYAKAIAALITSIGRNILMKTVELVKSKFSLEVIYGDTDSIMIDTLSEDLLSAIEIGKRIKSAVNEKYKLLEMEMDGIFKTLLLLKKKKYAALKYEAPFGPESKLVKEYKGLDLVRRDWCELSKQVGLYILDIILEKPKNKDEITTQILEFLKDVGDRLNKEISKDEAAYPYSVFEIIKQITKNIEDYGDSKTLPHVKVAKRLRQKGDLSIKVNSFIPYIVCYEKPPEDNNTNENENNAINTENKLIPNSKALADKCFHVKEITENKNLRVDVEWYKSNQILASVSRLCKHISQIDMHQLASNIGLDTNKYNSYLQNKNKSNELDDFNSFTNSNLKVKKVIKLQTKFGLEYYCNFCKENYKLDKIYCDYQNIIELIKCPKCDNINKDFTGNYNKILLQMKKNTLNYYKGIKTCMKCNSTTRLFFRHKCNDSACQNGIFKKNITESDCANEFNFLYHQIGSNSIPQNTNVDVYLKTNEIREYIKHYHSLIDYNYIDINKAFPQFLFENN